MKILLNCERILFVLGVLRGFELSCKSWGFVKLFLSDFYGWGMTFEPCIC